MPKLLIVSPHFPPLNAPDMQRVRMSLPHFVSAGWEVVVLAADDDRPLAPVEPELLGTVPAAVRVVRVPVLSRRWTARLGVNNLGWRAFPFLHAAARRLLRAERFDLVYFSTTQFAVLPLGRRWWQGTGVPYVIDLQDPWLSDYYERSGVAPPGGWKYRTARAFAQLLEGWTLRRCAHVISVSPAYLETLRRRYPWFGPASGSVITFGAPDEDFAVVRQMNAGRAPLLPASRTLKIAYAGRLGADMLPALDILFAAVARVSTRVRPVELFFFGTSYAQAGQGPSTTRALAEKHGIADRVHEQPDRIGYLSALRLLLETDLALLLGSDEVAYSPSKTYPTLSAERPTLAVMPRGSVLEGLVDQLGGVTKIAFAAATDATAIARTAAVLTRLAEHGDWQPDQPLQRARLRDHHSARAVAQRQLEIFTAVIRARAATAQSPAPLV